MQIKAIYSHLNGREDAVPCQEARNVIADVDAVKRRFHRKRQ